MHHSSITRRVTWVLFGSAWFCSVRFGPVRFDSIRFGSVWSVTSPITKWCLIRPWNNELLTSTMRRARCTHCSLEIHPKLTKSTLSVFYYLSISSICQCCCCTDLHCLCTRYRYTQHWALRVTFSSSTCSSTLYSVAPQKLTSVDWDVPEVWGCGFLTTDSWPPPPT